MNKLIIIGSISFTDLSICFSFLFVYLKLYNVS